MNTIHRLSILAIGIVVAIAAPAPSADIDTVGFPLLGKIVPRSAAEIASSTWSIGGETLDRDYAVYAHYRKYLGPLGAKAIRLQAGWAKTEKQKGVYNWQWLDEVVDDALAQAVQPWLETSYGNPIYEGGGSDTLGQGGPTSPEALAAWDRWVRELVRRYKDRVNEWEIWNEPDLRDAMTAESYADLFVRTAEIIRSEQPQARIDALALAGGLPFAEVFFERLKQQGKLGLVDVVTIHGYPRNPDTTSALDKMRELVARYSSTITVRQGETGAPSTPGTTGAMSGQAWTELKQAKWDLRRMLAHRAKDTPFNLFTLMDLHYPKGVNTKGLLKSNPDKTVDQPKPAYFAAQHVMTVFDDSVVRIPDFPWTSNAAEPVAVHAYRRGETPKQLVTIWFNGSPPTDNLQATAVDFSFPKSSFQRPVYVDLRTGLVYEIPQANWSHEGEGCVFRKISVYDSPILIAEEGVVPIAPAGESR